MKRIIQYICLCSCVLLLSACGKTVEEKAQIAVAQAEELFEQPIKTTSANVNALELYLPANFRIESAGSDSNYKILHQGDAYILFINTLEKDSRLYYELLQQDGTKQILQQQTFEQDGQFGFVAISQVGEQQYEMMASIAGNKLTTLTTERNMEKKLSTMVDIIRSVQYKK